MATKKKKSAKKAANRAATSSLEHGEPKFPYTTEPKALARLLTEIPKRPKPPKINLDTMKAWSVSKSNNARTVTTVMKKLSLLGSGGEPTDAYTEFMKTGTGPSVLGQKIKEVYKVLFENSHSPQTEPTEELKKLFNIHSGGGDDAMRLQIQTFKTLCDHATFSSVGSTGGGNATVAGPSDGRNPAGNTQALPPVQVDLHIHLPENKTSRDYQAIIQDIARYIYGKDIDAS